MIILLLLLFGIIYCIYLLYRNEEIYKTKCELIDYVTKTAHKEINRSYDLDNWNIYYDFLDKSASHNKLLFDFRINLNEFKENFIKEIDELYERNK